MRTALGVAVAGAAGALARYGVAGSLQSRLGQAFPWGTLGVNLIGSFLLGFVFMVATDRLTISPTVRIAVTIGFLGGFTTFSALTFETFRLLEDGAWALALANAAGSVVLGLGAVWAGVTLARLM